MILQVFLLLASALQILTYAAFMNFMLEPRFAPRLNFWLTAGGYLLAAVVSRLLEAHTLAKLLSANGLALLLVFVFFRSSVWHKLFALLYTWVTVFALDMGAMILCVQWLHLSEYEILTNPAVRLGVTYFNYVATLALWLIPIMRKLHRTTPLQRQTVKRFVFYPLGHLLLIVGFYWLVEQYPSPQLAAYFALACLYCIVVNIFLLKTMTDTAKKAELERKVQVMEYEKDRQMMEYDVLQEKERAVARLAHDYKNQLAVGLTLLEQKDYDRLADQLRDLSDSLTTTETVHFCANPVVNAVLANKAALCRRENITLEASLDVPEATGLSDGEARGFGAVQRFRQPPGQRHQSRPPPAAGPAAHLHQGRAGRRELAYQNRKPLRPCPLPQRQGPGPGHRPGHRQSPRRRLPRPASGRKVRLLALPATGTGANVISP